MATGNGKAIRPTTTNNTITKRQNDLNELMSENRNMQNAFDETSPLELFGRAKKSINDIYAEIEEYVVETAQLINALQSETDIVDKIERELFESNILRMSPIREILLRDNMKVAFLGHTSTGKTSVINAMLREKILPSGIGHTTNCFCQVEGSDGQESYIMKEGSEEKLNVDSIKQLANALCHEKRTEGSLVRIFWPRTRCRLLLNDIVFVDSPGVDVSANLDDCIDHHCLNADVFVLVLNVESTMTRAEKQFFHTFSQKLAKPNIFILNNRWDAFVNKEDSQESVKSQRKQRCIDFLTKELKVSNEKEAAERVFFVSARETLQARLEEANGNPPHLGAIAEGFQIRYFEFQDFERKFEECISQSAIRTKFEQHSALGKSVASDMRSMLDDVYERTLNFHNLKLDQCTVLTESIQCTETEIMAVRREMKLKIHKMAEEVEQEVSKALNEEICRLDVLIDEFNMPFHTESLVMNIYKKEMNLHLESELGSNLRARLSMSMAMKVEATQREMTERMHALVPSDKSIVLAKTAVHPQPFEMLYSLNCQNLCADFQEDLDFKFSLGIKQSTSSPTPLNTTPFSVVPTPVGGIRSEQRSWISLFAITYLVSEGTVGRLAMASIIRWYFEGMPCFQMLRTIGWRVPACVGALYGGMYLYERLSWTKAAKERAFKAQYVRHATKKLNMIVDLTSANCGYQVQQELWSTFAPLCGVVDNAMTGMIEEMERLHSQLGMLEAKEKQLKLLCNKANCIKNQLELFENSYIRAD